MTIVGLNILDGNFGREKLTQLVAVIKVVELSGVHRLMYVYVHLHNINCT